MFWLVVAVFFAGLLAYSGEIYTGSGVVFVVFVVAVGVVASLIERGLRR